MDKKVSIKDKDNVYKIVWSKQINHDIIKNVDVVDNNTGKTIYKKDNTAPK